MITGFYTSDEDYLVMVQPTEEAIALAMEREILCHDDAATFIIEKVSLPGEAITYLDISETPDLVWREAWALLEGKIVIDNTKAISVTKNHIRAWRDHEFPINDIAIQNALIDGDEEAKLTAVNRRDWLRSLPQSCDGKSLNELESLLKELGILQEVTK